MAEKQPAPGGNSRRRGTSEYRPRAAAALPELVLRAAIGAVQARMGLRGERAALLS